MPMRPAPSDRPRPLLVAGALSSVLAGAAGAQPAAVSVADPGPPPTLDACYVPMSGTIYRIDTPASPAPGAPKACLSQAHVKFTWNQQGVAGAAGAKGEKGDRGDAGPAGVAGAKGDKGDRGDKGEPGNVASIGPDLALAGRLEASKTGRFGGGLLATDSASGTMPSGAGGRFLWAAQKWAVRGGRVGAGHWDAANIGEYSTGFGRNTMASGEGATALGYGTTASGRWSTALGYNTTARAEGATALGYATTASGNGATALGAGTTASGLWSTALGYQTKASGQSSTALGNLASTAGRTGAFVYGDASSSNEVQATADNQFLVRAAGGVQLRTSSDLAKGCNVDDAGNLACTGKVTGTNVTATGGIAGFQIVTVGEVVSPTINQLKIVTLTATCPSGKVAISGGGEAPFLFQMSENALIPGSQRPTQWQVSWFIPQGWAGMTAARQFSYKAYAVCASVG